MATVRTRQLKKPQFIEAYRRLGTITAAAEAAGVARGTHYEWLRNDPEYAAEFRQAEEAVADMLEREAIRRAVEGTERFVYHQGEVVGAERQFSDTLLIFLLKGHRPEKFKDRTQVTSEVTVHDGSEVDREIARLAAELAGRAEGRAAGGTPVAGDSEA